MNIVKAHCQYTTIFYENLRDFSITMFVKEEKHKENRRNKNRCNILYSD